MFLGTLLIGASNIFRILLQFLLLPVLARILGPDAYGLMALAMPFILFINVFSDAGMGGALVREKNPSVELESSVFWAALVIPSLLALALAGLSLPAASLLARPEAAPVIMALCPVMVLSGLTSVPTARILRAERFAALATSDVASTILSAASAITAALLGLGVWSLVIQQVVLWTVKFLVLTVASRLRIRPVFRPRELKPLLFFGLNGVGASLLDMIARTIDSLIVGRLLGVTALGYYTMSFQISRMPETLVVGPLFTVLFPTIARLRDAPEEIARHVLGALRQMCLICAPALAGLALVAHPLVEVALGHKWAPAAPVLSLLPITGFALCVSGLSTGLLFGIGRTDLKLRLSLLSTACTLAGIVVGARFGIEGVAAGLAIGGLVILAAAAFVIFRYGRVRPAAAAAALAPIAIACGVMACAVIGVRVATAALPNLIELVAGVGAGALAYGACLLAIDRRRILSDVAVLRERLRRRTAAA